MSTGSIFELVLGVLHNCGSCRGCQPISSAPQSQICTLSGTRMCLLWGSGTMFSQSIEPAIALCPLAMTSVLKQTWHNKPLEKAFILSNVSCHNEGEALWQKENASMKQSQKYELQHSSGMTITPLCLCLNEALRCIRGMWAVIPDVKCPRYRGPFPQG